MKKPRRHGNLTVSNYPEELVGFALESFLALFAFPFSTYTIEPFSRSRERTLGADARLESRIKGFSPLYLQFKKPSAYESASSSKIITDRRAHGLSTKPRALFFPLRDKMPRHHDYQHNILLTLSSRLKSRGLGDAIYVCPLFLDRDAYRVHMQQSAIWRYLPFPRRHPYALQNLGVRDAAGHYTLRGVPVLANHACIRPHVRVNDAKHHYSFSETGADLCFHSPTQLPDHIKLLSQWIEDVLVEFVDGKRRVTGDSAMASLKSLLDATEDKPVIRAPKSTFDTESGFEAWYRFGEFLEAEYAISQFAIVEWSTE